MPSPLLVVPYKVYERGGFAPYWHVYTDKATGVVYRSMIYELRRSGPGE